jgi:hypothetical protein
MFTEFLNVSLTPERLITSALTITNPSNQLVALQMMTKEHHWQPLTLEQNGLFYIAFGSLLGIGAWKRTVPDSSTPTA